MEGGIVESFLTSQNFLYPIKLIDKFITTQIA